METENYLQIMTSSLEKKKKILQDIVDYNVEQERIVTSGEFDGDKFQKNMENKAECIDMLNVLDEGFQSVYDRVKADVEMYKQSYKADIQRLQQLIKEVSALSATIQYFAQMGYEVSMNDKKEDDYTLLNISWEEK